MTESNLDVLAAPVRTARIIFILLLGSQAVYGWLVPRFLQTGETVSLMEAVATPAGSIFLAYAIGALIASFIVPNLLIKSAFNRSKQAGQKVQIRQFGQTMFVSMIVALALREAVSLMGLAGALSSQKSIGFAYILIGAGSLSMLASWPSEERWAKIYEEKSSQ